MTDRERLLDEALIDYTNTVSIRYTINTWRQHAASLERFREYAHDYSKHRHVYLSDCDDKMVTDFFKGLRPTQAGTRDYSDGSFNNFRAHLRGFFRFVLMEGWIALDPMRHVRHAKERQKRRLQLTPAELQAILVGAGERDRVALALGMHTGLRAGDIMSLKVGDVMLDTGYIAVSIQKTKKVDSMPITEELHEELVRWFVHYAEATGHAGPAELPNWYTLVPPLRSQPLDPRDMSLGRQVVYRPEGTIQQPARIVHRALTRIGHATYREGFHTIRRSAGRMVHDVAVQDGDQTSALRVAQTFLGHENQLTTELYLGLEVDRQARDRLLRGNSLLRRAVELNEQRQRQEDETVESRPKQIRKVAN